MKKMKAIIISAGYGSRLENKTKDKPKGLLDINGRSIIERQISLFKKNGINDIIIITGPIENFGIKNVSYINDKNYDEHDVLGSLMAAKIELTGEIITSYSDILFEERILKQIIASTKNIGIPIDLKWEKSYENRTEHPKSEADNVLLKNKQIIKIQKGIFEKKHDEAIGEFLGPIKFSSKGMKSFVSTFEKLEKNHEGSFHNAPSLKKAYLTDLLQELIDTNIEVSPIFVEGKWCEIDTPQDLERAVSMF
jgi:L-glutamine-phosphate cytidylyltransferase